MEYMVQSGQYRLRPAYKHNAKQDYTKLNCMKSTEILRSEQTNKTARYREIEVNILYELSIYAFKEIQISG